MSQQQSIAHNREMVIPISRFIQLLSTLATKGHNHHLIRRNICKSYLVISLVTDHSFTKVSRFNSAPSDKFLDLSKLKIIADDKINAM